MTKLEDIKEYYKNLLIIQYHNKPKAAATVSEWVRCMCGDALMSELVSAFDIDTAKGAQLDMIGSFVGLGRNNQNDEKYRVLLKLKILKNNIYPSMKNIDDALFNYFGSLIMMNNNKDMTITYILNNELGDVIQILINENLLPAPLGVGVNIITRTNPDQKYFGYERGDTSTEAVGFSENGNMQEAIWLSSDDIA